MPVLVTNADTSFGTALVARLLATGGQVRAYCSGGGGSSMLRQMGAIAAGGDVDDEGRLEAACEQVHTLIHLGGGLLSPSPERIVKDAATVATAAANAGVQRVVMLSVPGAGAQADDDFRRAKGAAEDVLADCSVPSVIVRTGLVLDGLLAQVLAGTPVPPTLAQHHVNVVSRDALVEVLWMLDEMRSESTSGHAVLSAPGPVTAPLGQVIEELGGPGGTYRPLDQAPLLAVGLGGPWLEADAVVADAWALTGVKSSLAAVQEPVGIRQQASQ